MFKKSVFVLHIAINFAKYYNLGMKKRILTGDRTTGKLHLGHYVGSLKSRVALQHEYDTFILLADVQALTTHFDNVALLETSIMDVAKDNLSVGLDPNISTIVQQSQVTSIAELTVFYSMLVTVPQLSHNPTIKTEARNYGYKEMTYGFLGYPVSQTADITFCNADLVPVGEDQRPHLEMARDIVKKFNALYGTSIVEPDIYLSTTSRLQGLDGKAKMGKSMGNAIFLTDSREEVEKKVKSAVTDTTRVSVKMPGHPDTCPVFGYHKAFASDAANTKELCENAGIGCVACKKHLSDVLNDLLDPIRERRAYWDSHENEVKEIIHSGTEKANKIGNENIKNIKEKMHILIK